MFEIRPFECIIVIGTKTFDLPEDFSPHKYHQFRFVSKNGQTEVHIDAFFLGAVENANTDYLSIVIKESEVSFDMIRHTLI